MVPGNNPVPADESMQSVFLGQMRNDGKVAVYLNWRPYPNGLGEMGIPKTLGEQKRVEKRKNKGNHINMGGKKTFLPDAERDESRATKSGLRNP